jgi:hypothetical protein
MIDLIGDIHGYADELEALLLKMGYEIKAGSYAHRERKALFVGDYIDRGPKIKETLDIVRRMVDSDNAIALMGNHEYNALCYHLIGPDGNPLREHSNKNVNQHKETLEQFKSCKHEFRDYLEWFKTLPLFYETEGLRAVHACWDYDNIEYLRNALIDDKLTEDLIHQSVVKDTKMFQVIDETLKGKEMPMPNELFFEDKGGEERTDFRIKWWENPVEMTYRSISVLPLEILPEDPVPKELLKTADHYLEDNKPVFFGHYWLKGNPSLYRNNICCLDYSVAKKGKLVAYRLDQETTLNNSKFVFV